MDYPLYPMSADNNAFLEIAPGVWVMDDHKWAFYVWCLKREQLPKVLFHMDYHWDNADNFTDADSVLYDYIEYPEKLKKILSKDHLIRKDSFIAPAIRTDFFREVHFYCYQRNTPQGLDPLILQKKKVRQYLHKTLDDVLEKIIPNETAFDLDLDFFNWSPLFGKGNLWSDEKILQVLFHLKDIIKKSPLITLALSYFYSGDVEDTHHLAEIILPLILSWRR
ncbi:MAG: UPF0489 family protein [Candidatus Marinimicrobia bacterium]|nr:UPF0489 family protein [Candidatus Neomarinimicrobiota bacterium]